MKSFRSHLSEKFKDLEFKKYYEEEKHLLALGVKIAEMREKLGMSQKELAKQCNVTQQQLSKIENGVNCNLLTFLKVSEALGLSVNLQ
ncbi:MAG: helix-turn-helix transcriptional regulator [Fusobacteriaceae bacterium]|jgi:DNA-binding XRE family transcriptional regulator|nr:helix-turn-helix transcriptional regulator [Fusobacteriaceae bacterium]